MNTKRLYESNLDSPHNLPYRDLVFDIGDISAIIGNPSTALNLMRSAFAKEDYERAAVLAIRVMEMERWNPSSTCVRDAYSTLHRIVNWTEIGIGTNLTDQLTPAKSLGRFIGVALNGFTEAGQSPPNLEDTLCE